ncbi:MAG TPA: ATP-dependent zinc metalloprotease FtsH, partial [Bdellovibrionota bacterium]|nr:ATP-dependent zinc metalloprotease FtsH [Bdellovibrionota bacterium]
EFLTELQAGRLDSVRIVGDKLEAVEKTSTTPAAKAPGEQRGIVAMRMEDPDLIQRLKTAGIKFGQVPDGSAFRDVMSWILPMLLMLGFWWFVMGRMGRTQGQVLSLGKSKAKVYAEKDVPIRFADVAGVDEAKDELREMVEFLRNPAAAGRLGGRLPKGLLLVGPPGTGKTLLARAVAGEAQVPFFSINGSEFVEMFVGLGAARVRDLFEQARAHAPCIIFVDELDALGRARASSIMANDEKEQTLNQFLAELDGFDPSKGVVLLAATNRPEVLDPALLRSGRFDRQILIDKPDRAGRVEVLKVHLRTVRVAPDCDPGAIAALTPGFSGADLANLVNEAARMATRRGASAVETADFHEAIERMMGGLERRNRIMRPEERRRVAFHEMGHATAALALDPSEAVQKVSIIPRSAGALGFTMRRPLEDRYLLARGELEAKLAVLLGGRASEMIFLHESSTGAADDLDKATDIARAMVTRFGMSELAGQITYDREQAPYLGTRVLPGSHDYSDETARVIDQEILKLVDHAYDKAARTLARHRTFLEEGVRQLLQNETLAEETLKDLWARHSEVESQAKGA